MIPADPTLAEMVDQAITNNPHLSRRKLRIETDDGRVVLLGTVNTYYQKQMAQESVRGIHGVLAIDNRLTVSA
jgi:osmotically-inducible protein OsmY